MNKKATLATINFSDEISIDSDTILISKGLIYEPGRGHNKHKSTDLYPTGNWVPSGDSVVTGQALIAPEKTMSVFKVPNELIEEITKQKNPKDGESGGEPFALSEEVKKVGSNFVNAVLGDEYTLDTHAIMLRSFPSLGLSTGKTTNGFHFDDGSNDRKRLGINLGDIPRRSIFVPTARQEILDQLDIKNEGDVELKTYPEIAKLPLSAVAVKINVGEGWSLSTVDHLHDGRRAVDDGFSCFVLLSATRQS